MFDVRLGRFGSVMRGVLVVAMSQMRVVRRRLVVPFFMVPGGFPVMARRVFVMFSCFLMMLHSCMGHRFSPCDCVEAKRMESATTMGLSHRVVKRA